MVTLVAARFNSAAAERIAIHNALCFCNLGNFMHSGIAIHFKSGNNKSMGGNDIQRPAGFKRICLFGPPKRFFHFNPVGNAWRYLVFNPLSGKMIKPACPVRTCLQYTSQLR